MTSNHERSLGRRSLLCQEWNLALTVRHRVGDSHLTPGELRSGESKGQRRAASDLLTTSFDCPLACSALQCSLLSTWFWLFKMRRIATAFPASHLTSHRVYRTRHLSRISNPPKWHVFTSVSAPWKNGYHTSPKSMANAKRYKRGSIRYSLQDARILDWVIHVFVLALEIGL